MDQNYALVQNGIVINVCVWDGDEKNNPLSLPDGVTAVLIPEGSPAWIGWGYTVAGGFTAPPAGTTD
jgi:hypothetical protein